VIDVKAEVTGATAVAGRLEGAEARILAMLARTVTRLGIELQRHVKADYLTGQALHVRSGRLRRGVNEKTVVGGTLVTATVGDNVSYARVHELGFQGSEEVKAHVRKTAHGVAQVRAFTRQANIPARPFLAPALADMREKILSKIGAAVKAGI
jgi:phage gpG-like protein